MIIPPHFYGVVVVRKDSKIDSLNDLHKTRFAYGSRSSTLAFYAPAFLLLQAGIKPTKLKSHSHLQRHDTVVQHVIMGRQDAGGVKESVAAKYDKFLKVIARTPPIHDHAVVVSQTMSPALRDRLLQALLKLDDAAILKSVKPSLTGFLPADRDVYDSLIPIMQQVDDAYRE